MNRNTEAHRSGNMSVKSQLSLDESVARALQHTENRLVADPPAAGDGGRSSNPTDGNGALTNTSDVATRQDNIDPDDMTYEELQALGDAVGVETRGLSDELISFLPTFINTTKFALRNGHTECVICLTPYENGEKLIALPCQHQYHSHCIKEWLKINKTCPVCIEEVFG